MYSSLLSYDESFTFSTAAKKVKSLSWVSEGTTRCMCTTKCAKTDVQLVP